MDMDRRAKPLVWGSIGTTCMIMSEQVLLKQEIHGLMEVLIVANR